ncbi:hypothetical protein SPRG_07829 [Saprolegnia parasitica CBS 223.65]|uniref:Uncharacterized protein n=1 Tax=Saprolegnia parasitica (strain CBS 223.65) TaxID=695850 RepID=A0A067C9E3_SAPPC|nr:hypothetical protein SPRG_07829 [Saprolegnia parasitica CBS 223.65]KDO27118.1 hypothetical protein SPRG_07829 [Saprolegnia parasitica CBS 223.65]|eukprot:XP_012202211.1 hypothetical protein SPRG_07829 [Saprolegnia parasitica CBS 223.65]
MRCVFRDCSEPVLPDSHKCAFHKNRRLCSVIGCENQVYARKLCVKHGARKRCSFPKCHAFTQGYAACPDHHFWPQKSSPKTQQQQQNHGSPYSSSSDSSARPHRQEGMDAFVLAFTPQWIESYDLAWLEAV